MQKTAKWFLLFLSVFTVVVSTSFQPDSVPGLKTNDIRIRDPFIYPDIQTKTYFMYAQAKNRKGSSFTGVEVYTSKDLLHWSSPQPVLKLPEDAGIQSVWAPEMHNYKDNYYLFVTLTYKKKLKAKKPVNQKNWPEMHIRGTHVYYADSPLGPFMPFKKTSFTPEAWMALDGTLYVEDGLPYMVFCHEWVQTIDGTIDYVQLKKDFSGTTGKPQLLFKAGSAPGAIQDPNQGKVTDGCFLYRSPDTGRLFMIWSTFIPVNGYCVLLTYSESGKISGPWKEQKIIYSKNGGHGMIFRAFNGDLILALHQPNTNGKERLHLFKIIDKEKTLTIEKEILTKQLK